MKIKSSDVRTVFLAMSLGLYACASSPLALADYRDNGAGHDARGDVHRGPHPYYRNGHWYRHGWFGFGVALPTLSTGVYVDTLPPVYTPVVVQGATYYYGDNTYFTAAPQGGYMVVTAPR